MATADRAAPSAPRAPQGESLDARRRQQLIEATTRAIATYGLSGTTVARVAKIAGLSTGIVNFYFRSKDALLLATLQTVDRDFAERQREALERAGNDPVRQLDAMIEVDFDPDVSDPDRVAVWNAFWGEARAREDYQRVCGRREAEDARRVVELFEQIARRGGYEHLDPKTLGRAFHHLLSSLPEDMLQNPASFDPEAAKATCRSFLASIFPAEFAAPAPAARTRRAVEETAVGLQRTLPGWVYRAPELHPLEMEAIFRRQWLLVGHASEVPGPGSHLAVDVAGERALVVRGADGELRAFHNVCSHRASSLVPDGVGLCDGAIVCPAHGWRYDLDGRLLDVPAAGSYPGLDASRSGLSEIGLAEWMGFVFVRLEGGGGPDLEAEMQPFEDDARQHRLGEMRARDRRWSRSFDFDWKLLAESLAEGHRLPGGRSGLWSRIEAQGDDEADEGGAWRQSYVLREAKSCTWSERMYWRLMGALERPQALDGSAWVCYRMFPGAEISVAHGRADARQVLPLGPGRCRILGFSVDLGDDRRETRAAGYLRARIARRLMDEDVETCAGIAAGLRSSGYRAGLLSELESGVRRFQGRLRELVPVTRSERAPAPGTLAARNEEMRIAG